MKDSGQGETRGRALDGITIGFDRARLTAVIGPSGSGKPVLLVGSDGTLTPYSY